MATPPVTKPAGTGINKKVGPLPLWMWAVLAGGGVAALLYLRSRSSKAQSTATQDCPSGQVDANGNCVSSIDQTQLAIVPVPEPTGTSATPGPGPAPQVASYTVKKGDTWTAIARRLGTTPQDLYYYQFSDAGITKNTQAFRTKIAEFGPHSIITGNVIAYPTSGVYPHLAGFNYHTTKAGFWNAGKDKTKEKPTK